MPPQRVRKFVVVLGGVMSGLGKGGVTSSLARTFAARQYSVTALKIDPYINIDAGLFSPYEHGEVFVLDDGSEVDQDLGNYERFLDITLTRDHNITTGKVYREVIAKERRGDYLGKTVQIIPHITDMIKERISKTAERDDADITLIEVGGTVGDIESMPFLEAVRQLQREKGRENVAFVLLALTPELSVVGEQKTKPVQHSVHTLMGAGIQPDAIICRSRRPLDPAVKKKVALFCNVPEDAVISDPDVGTIYELPFVFEEEGLPNSLCARLGAFSPNPVYGPWKKYVKTIKSPGKLTVKVAVTGKYTSLRDAYLSIHESMTHAAAHLGVDLDLAWLETTDMSDSAALEGMDGVIVPGGFGSRGTEGKIAAIGHARENGIPFLGLCFGFQLAVAEFARTVCGLERANSTENDAETPHPVIDLLPGQRDIQEMGGTMRLGTYPATLAPGTRVRALYGGAEVVDERHRHRYEVNHAYVEQLEKAGLAFSGRSPDGNLMEFLELPGHPFFVATQAHPEFKSRLERPAPLFLGFLKAAVERARTRLKGKKATE